MMPLFEVGDYENLADVVRVEKSAGSDLQSFYYDGQMPIEDAAVVGSATTVTRNGLGARGIDFISTTTSSGTNVAYPIYDGHGNMVATLAKNGSGYTIGNRRSFGAWGEIRQGATSGSPKGRYCANLGHLDDDESGLTYMRARYYEAGSGRFLSEDLARDNLNWLIYSNNNPVSLADPDGKAPGLAGLRQFLALVAAGLGLIMFGTIGIMITCGDLNAKSAAAMAKKAVWLYNLANSASQPGWLSKDEQFFVNSGISALMTFGFNKLIDTVCIAAEQGKRLPGQGKFAIGMITGYSLLLIAELIADFSTNGVPFDR